MKKNLFRITIIIVLLAVACMAFFLLTHTSISNVVPSRNTFTDVQTGLDGQVGFKLTIPAVWNDSNLSYIETLADKKTGEIHYEFHLTAIDPNTSYPDQNYFTTVSSFSAIPRSTYKPKVCGDTPLCSTGTEIGRNNVFIFISYPTSPEAFGFCTRTAPNFDIRFYNANKELCEKGPESRNPELTLGGFTTFPINQEDYLFEKGVKNDLNLDIGSWVDIEKQVGQFYRIGVHMGGGHFVLAKKLPNGHYESLYSGQVSPSCGLMKREQIPSNIINEPCQ